MIDPERIVSLIETAGRLVGMKEVLRAGGLHPGEQTELKRILRDLVRDGRVSRDGKRYGIPGLKPEKLSGPVWQGKPGPSARVAAVGPTKRELPAPKGRFTRTWGEGVVHERPVPRAPARELKKPAKALEVPATKQKARPSANVMEGIIHHHPDGFAFVHPLTTKGENVFIAPEEAGKALDHDRVRVEIIPGRGGRTAGRVVEVVTRTRQVLIGTYREARGAAWVEPKESGLGSVKVPPTQLARDGDVVKVRLGIGEGLLKHSASELVGEVAGSMGAEADHSVEVLSIAFSRGFHDEFPPEVMDEADAFELTVSEHDAKGEHRKDLRKLPLITIDGEDARDFDDAICVEDHPKGWRLVVAIADVSHYVREHTALDDEALRRATSVYLPGRVLPMLPERLSNGICSLKPDEDRLCMVADLVIDPSGDTVETEIYPAVMRSHARCTYTEVHQVLAGEQVPGRWELKAHFERAFALSKTLTAMRMARGAIDFDLPETRPELGPDGLPTKLVRRERWESHRLVEECMLAANEAVARFCREQELPTVNRYHGEPDEDRLGVFMGLLNAYGVHVKPGPMTSKQLNRILGQLVGHPEQRGLHQLALRSMMQAVYSSSNGGHYGLGAEDYLHFTSPIRRYPDLLVHRLLKAFWARKKKPSPGAFDAETERLDELALQSSERERAAMQVEREVNSLYSCLLMKDRVGEEFAASISGIAEHGFYVELEELFVEGLVKGETVNPDYEFDVETHRLNFGDGRVVKVGLPCRVQLASVNMERRQLDFVALEIEGESVTQHPAHVRGSRAPRGSGPKGRGGASARRGEKPSDDRRSGHKPYGKSAPARDGRGGGKPTRGEPRTKSGASQHRERAPEPAWRSKGAPARAAEPAPAWKKNKVAPARDAEPRLPAQPSWKQKGAPVRSPQPPAERAPTPPPRVREAEPVEAQDGAPRSFDARAVLDRLWRERGGQARRTPESEVRGSRDDRDQGGRSGAGRGGGRNRR
jgi:ribonuclease R